MLIFRILNSRPINRIICLTKYFLESRKFLINMILERVFSNFSVNTLLNQYVRLHENLCQVGLKKNK